MIAILSGGVGAARFALGMRQIIDPTEISIISNVGDDEVLHGLHISPDIDTVTYTLGNAINPDTGWGLKNETWHAMDALTDYGGITWFRLGDRDLATHLFRTQLLSEGKTLTQVTDRIRKRWKVQPRILPVTDDELRTVLYSVIDGRAQQLTFQEYFVRYAHKPAVSRVIYEHSAEARMTPSVIQALENAEAIVIAPSNPILSIGPILAVPGVSEILSRRRERVVAISPIVAGQAVKGPAAKLMAELGLRQSAYGVAEYYKDIISAIVIDDTDAGLADQIRLLGIKTFPTNTLMTSPETSKNLASAALSMISGEPV
ncbi:MAG: 2-phospho-L-lactate transferase [Actinomycetota bacterium]|nr:MAG: 2-phospho-L-lactate transferase [Actinomycetota bacterium]